ncbi:sugar phosphate isomerase/epimerase [Horticoccus luteus]|uniref:Sugar phosphate isomerase/epimerase n=1 Tax=Horticoccus luteus TaxID=2862869 RepID=A0A8F9TVM9_9BACT|nr:TIM barrel protein [Horticoccus luteus]QYM79138.1 sugar phosphate isomerase/epimerase [Horticoccus luteus]
MSFPNPLVLFNNHFVGHRRAYPWRTRLAVAADLGFDGYEFHPLEPHDDQNWDQATAAYRASGLHLAGMYIVAKGITDDEFPRFDAEVTRAKQIIDRLAALDPHAFVNFTIFSNPAGQSTPDYRDAGSAQAEPRHWERAALMLREIDAHLAARGLTGNLYNHIWFMIDTPAAQLRALREAGAKVLRPGLALFHAFFHLGVPDLPDVLAQPGMEQLDYFAVLNGWPKPAEPFRTRPLDDGNIDVAAALGLLWSRGYRGPIVSQAYDLGGDPYETARRARDYLRDVHARFERNPALNPFA